MTTLTHLPEILEKLEALRTELADLAFDLERRGRSDAADLAIAVSGRLAELQEDSPRGQGMSGTKRIVR